MLLRRGLGIAGEIDAARCLINAHNGLHCPCALGQLRPFAVPETINMAEAITLRRPDKAAVGKHAQIVMQVQPGLAGFAEQHARRARCGIDLQHIEPFLVAALALHQQAFRVGHPVHPRQIDVGIGAKIDLYMAVAGLVPNKQVDTGIVCASKGIALLVNAGALGPDCGARGNLHAAFIDPGIGKRSVIGGPPMAAAAVHLFLRDKFSNAIAQRAAAITGQRLFRTVGQAADDKILVAHERNMAALGANGGIKLTGRGLGQTAGIAL